MQHIDSLLDLVSGKVNEMAQSDVVVGEPIELGDITLVPLSRVSLGFGGGGGQGEGSPGHRNSRRRRKGASNPEPEAAGEGKGQGAGAGGGGKVRPVGVIIFSPDGVTIEAITDRKGVLDKIMDRVPDIIDLIKDAVDK